MPANTVSPNLALLDFCCSEAEFGFYAKHGAERANKSAIFAVKDQSYDMLRIFGGNFANKNGSHQYYLENCLPSKFQTEPKRYEATVQSNLG